MFIGGWLESPYWLLLAFCPKILGGGRDLRIAILLNNECSLSHDGGDTQTLLVGKKQFELYALWGSGDAKTLWFSLAL